MKVIALKYQTEWLMQTNTFFSEIIATTNTEQMNNNNKSEQTQIKFTLKKFTNIPPQKNKPKQRKPSPVISADL